MKLSGDILKEFNLEPEEEKTFLQELLLKNEITHDYFNRELHQQKVIWIMRNCCQGAMDAYLHVNEYCTEKGLLGKYVSSGNRK